MRETSLTLRRTNPLHYVWPIILGVALLLAQTLAAAAQSRPETFADLAEKVSPSARLSRISSGISLTGTDRTAPTVRRLGAARRWDRAS